MKYSVFVDQYVFQPLKMKRARFILDAKPIPNAAALYFDKTKPLPVYYNDSYPDCSVHTSLEDLTAFVLE